MKKIYSKNTNLVSSTPFGGQHPPVIRVKTDGRIGTATPHSQLKGGFTVDNNRKMSPPAGDLGSTAASHMNPGPNKGPTWSPRVLAARKMAKPNAKAYANPVNAEGKTLRRMKPD